MLPAAVSAQRLVRACRARASALGLAPPAVFVGDWAGGHAVVVPSVDLAPCPPGRAFDAPRPGAIRVGYRSFPDAPHGGPAPLPEAVSGLADGALVLGGDGEWSAVGDVPGPREVVARWGPHHDDDEPSDRRSPAPDAGPSRATFAWSAPDRAAHRAAVLDCLEQIRAGEIYQACLSTRLDGRVTGDPLEAFLSLVSRSPAARSGFLAGPWGAVLGVSPEEFLIRDGDTVRTSPIKGTLPADRPVGELLASGKDVAENIMIVDLARNDLGRVAEVGSVTVTDLLAARPAPGVHHLVSTVLARTRVPNAELVEACFPPASVTGTPKLRARELIAGWEPRSRGLHCGTYGFALADSLELAVAIRTVEVTPDGRAELGVGGGITIDSDPDAEWRECLAKAAFTWGGGPPGWA